MAGAPGILDRFSLDGRIAVVSGGAGPQFGSSISEALAEAGATVISASRSIERNELFVAGLLEQDSTALTRRASTSRSPTPSGHSPRMCRKNLVARTFW